jgi:hypothetical protein
MPLLSLPVELQRELLCHLDAPTYLTLTGTCRQLFNLRDNERVKRAFLLLEGGFRGEDNIIHLPSRYRSHHPCYGCLQLIDNQDLPQLSSGLIFDWFKLDIELRLKFAEYKDSFRLGGWRAAERRCKACDEATVRLFEVRCADGIGVKHILERDSEE